MTRLPLSAWVAGGLLALVAVEAWFALIEISLPVLGSCYGGGL